MNFLFFALLAIAITITTFISWRMVNLISLYLTIICENPRLAKLIDFNIFGILSALIPIQSAILEFNKRMVCQFIFLNDDPSNIR